MLLDAEKKMPMRARPIKVGKQIFLTRYPYIVSSLQKPATRCNRSIKFDKYSWQIYLFITHVHFAHRRPLKAPSFQRNVFVSSSFFIEKANLPLDTICCNSRAILMPRMWTALLGVLE